MESVPNRKKSALNLHSGVVLKNLVSIKTARCLVFICNMESPYTGMEDVLNSWQVFKHQVGFRTNLMGVGFHNLKFFYVPVLRVLNPSDVSKNVPTNF